MKDKAVKVHFPKLNLDDLLPQDKEYKCSIMKQEDLEPCLKIQNKCFLEGEPFTIFLNFTEQESLQNIQPYTEAGLKAGLNIVISLRNSGQILGCCANIPKLEEGKCYV